MFGMSGRCLFCGYWAGDRIKDDREKGPTAPLWWLLDREKQKNYNFLSISHKCNQSDVIKGAAPIISRGTIDYILLKNDKENGELYYKGHPSTSSDELVYTVSVDLFLNQCGFFKINCDNPHSGDGGFQSGN
jgi:hypothetical protein